MNETVSLSPPPVQDQTVSLDTGTPETPPVSPDTAASRASKIEMGLSSVLGQTRGDAFTALVNGQETQLRNNAAATLDSKKVIAKQQAVTALVQSNPNIQSDPKALQMLTTPPDPTDPDSVVEHSYASSFVKPMLDPAHPWISKTSLPQVMTDQPEALAGMVAATTDFMKHREYAVTRLQNAEDAYQHQGWGSWAVDQAKDLSEIYTEYKLRGNTDSSFWSGLLGANLEQQRQDYYDLPFDQFKTKFDATMDQLTKDNPGLAVMFAHAVVGQSTDDQVMSDQFTMLGLSEVGALGKLGAGIVRRFSASTTAKDLVRASANVDVDGTVGRPVPENEPRVQQASGLGDMSEAGVQKVSAEVADDLTGKSTPEQRLVMPLNTYLRQGANAIVEAPGNAGQEVANRIGERLNQLDTDLSNMMSNLMRVNRTPILQASEDAVRQLKDNVKFKYAGPNSTIMNVSDPILEPKSNTYHMELQIGNHNGEMFPTFDEAMGFTEQYPLSQVPRRLSDELADRITELNFKIAENDMKVKTFQPSMDKAEGNLLDRIKGETVTMSDERARMSKQLDDLHRPSGVETLKGMEKAPREYSNFTEFRKAARGAGLKIKDLKDAGLGNSIEFEDAKASKPVENVTLPATTGAEIRQHGAGWYISKMVPVAETDPAIRSMLLKMPGMTTPYLPEMGKRPSFAAVLKTFGTSKFNLSAGRTPRETLTPVEQAQRAIVAHGPNAILSWIKDNDKIAKAVPRKHLEDFHRTLVFNQTDPHPITGRPGHFFTSPHELDDHYQRYYHRFPTESEYEGYFAYTSNLEIDRAMRALGMLRNKWRLGVERYRIGMPNKQGGPMSYSNYIDAVPVPKLPRTADSAFIGTVNKGDERVVDLSRIGEKARKGFDEAIQNGQMKVLQIHEPDTSPLHHFSSKIKPENRIIYILTDNYDSKPLDFSDQVPKVDGGHWSFDSEHYLKRADMVHEPTTGKWIYRGDQTYTAHKLRIIGDRLGEHLNKLVPLIAEGKDDEARQLHGGRFGMNFDDDILRHWMPGKGPNGEVLPPRFARNHEPFTMVPKGSTIVGLDNSLPARYGKDFVDGTTHGSLAKSSQIEFTGERDAFDLHTVEDVGTSRNPLYQYRPAELMDPIESMNRALSRIINSAPFMDDYKYMAAEHFLAQYMPWIKDEGGKAIDPSRVWHSPFHYFNKDDLFLDDMPSAIRNMAMSNRKKMRDFIGTPSKWDVEILRMSQDAADALYGKGGVTVVPLNNLSYIKTPLQAIRTLTVHAKLGLFALGSAFTQGWALTNALMLRLPEAPSAVASVMFHEWSRWAPQHVEAMDELMSRFHVPSFSRHQAGWWQEAHDAIVGPNIKTGFGTVGHEHAILGSAASNHVLSNTTEKVKYWGQAFFREGAQSVRYTAWYAAHLEYRMKNPVGPISRAGWDEITSRATDLDHNMDRSANSALNSGVMSFPGMFYTYALRMNELFWGKRLSPAEKARLFLGNSLLWGVPAGGLGLMLFPTNDMFRKYAITHGDSQVPAFVNGDDTTYSVFMNGAISWAGAMITGHGDSHAGTWYDTSKYGVQGWNPLNELTGDQTTSLMNIIGGAPYSTVANTLYRSSGFYHAMIDMITGNASKDPLTFSDVTDMFKECSSCSAAIKMFMAVHTGKLVSNNNMPMQDIGLSDAFFRSLTGLTDSDVSDLSVLHSAQEDRKGYINQVTSRYAHEYHLAMLALNNDNIADKDKDSEFQTHWKKAGRWLDISGLTTREKARVANEVGSQQDNLVDASRWDLAFKNVPDDQVDNMEDARQRWLQIQRQKQGK